MSNAGFKPDAVAKTTTTGKPNIVTGTDPAAGKSIAKGSTVKVFYNARPGSKGDP